MNKLLSIIFIALVSCTSSYRDVDDSYPQILDSKEGSFPNNCQILNAGESFSVKYDFEDNYALANFSIEIHHNFDHHSHSTDINECEMLKDQDPVNAFHFIKIYDINNGVKKYRSDEKIFIPKDVDSGDYHLVIKLTDKTGWEVIKGISIRIL